MRLAFRIPTRRSHFLHATMLRSVTTLLTTIWSGKDSCLPGDDQLFKAEINYLQSWSLLSDGGLPFPPVTGGVTSIALSPSPSTNFGGLGMSTTITLTPNCSASFGLRGATLPCSSNAVRSEESRIARA